MATVQNVTPDVTESLPALLSARQASQVAVKDGTRFDVMVAGVGFFLDCDQNHPNIRQSAQVQKDQFDSSKEAGEQSLDQWWLRSQTSWHQGSGIRFYEPGTDETTQFRSGVTVGINVWTRDQATLLHSMDSWGPASQVTGAVLPSGGPALFVVTGGTINRNATGSGVAYTGAGAETRPVIAGQKVLTGYSGGIASGAIGGTTLTDLWTQASGATPVPYWVKDRIVATQGGSVFELTLAGGDLSAQIAVFTHPDPDWSWTSVAESPSGVLLAGESCGKSSIYLMTLDQPADGSTPKLGAPSLVASLPLGETVHCLASYLGSYVGIGTELGIRVGLLDDQGLQYGPLTVETAEPVLDITAGDSFLYGAVTDQIDGKSGVVRVSLEQPVSGLRFPWAWDVQTHVAGVASSVAMFGATGRVAVTVAGNLYIQSDTDFEQSGYVETGAIRFGTVEPKVYQSVDARIRTSAGESVTVEATLDTDSTYTLGNVAASGSTSLGFKLETPLEYLSLRFTLQGDGSSSPTLESWQIKALPKPDRKQRLIQYPLKCYDWIIPGRAQKYGGKGFAWTALQALEGLEDKYVTVQVQDNTVDETYTAVIEQVEFHRSQGRSADGDGNFGGLILLTARKL